MGGIGSGRHSSSSTAEKCWRIEIDWMVRDRRAIPCAITKGTLSWTCNGEPAGSVSYEADLMDLNAAELRLSYIIDRGSGPMSVQQVIALAYTVPNYGGRRWWMICPTSKMRVGKLYLPFGGGEFAGRFVWRVGYRSQRVGHFDRPFEKLFRLQNKLGCEPGWDGGLIRPKGMWARTFERHLRQYDALDEICSKKIKSIMDL